MIVVPVYPKSSMIPIQYVHAVFCFNLKYTIVVSAEYPNSSEMVLGAEEGVIFVNYTG